jgi:hypothetical protein
MRPPLITHHYDVAHDDTCEIIIANARWLVGLRADVPEDAAELRRIYGPGEWDLRKISGCALTAAGILERSGAAVPWAGKPYVPGSAVSRLVAWAQQCGCWVTPGPDRAPSPSDVIVVTASEHVCTIVDREADTIITVDGGQAYPGVILECRRPWHTVAGRWHLGGRPVLGWVLSTSLPWGATVTEPGTVDTG